MTATLRTQLARSRQAKAGSKRVEVVLDAVQLRGLQKIKDRHGFKTPEAIAYAIQAALIVITQANKSD